MHARTLRPKLPAQDLHVDYERDSLGWTMVGFIFMIDEFRGDNGATRFVPGSHLWSDVPHAILKDRKADYPGQVLACGAAGSMVLFNGSVWHGHTVNSSDKPRRSIQGAYIRRDAESGEDLPARIHPDTLSRISPLAKHMLAVKLLKRTDKPFAQVGRCSSPHLGGEANSSTAEPWLVLHSRPGPTAGKGPYWLTAPFPAGLRQGRSDRRSSLCSTPLRSLSQTPPSSRYRHGLPRERGAASSNRRSDRHGCRST
jgi:hypothetical protein